MMRLTKARRGPSAKGPEWIVEGKVSGEYALLLKDEYQALSPEDRTGLRINLEGVTFVDDRGIEILSEMQKEKVEFEGARGFVLEMLGRGADREPGGEE